MASGPRPDSSSISRLPPRRLPLLYFGFAHASLIAGLAVIALDPRGVGGFFYHDRMLAVVHLGTLGWITASILGALYIVGPVALRTPLPSRRLDAWCFGCVAAGIAGMVTHFWISELGGMAWSGALVTLGVAGVGVRVVPAVRAAPVHRAVTLHIALAFTNFMIAAGFGILLAIDRFHEVVPGYVLTNLFAHAHLAGLGWATMMVAGVGYRLIPMVLPAAMPTGTTLYLSAVLVEAGTLGVFVGLLRGAAPTLAATLAVAGLAAFLLHVGWMLRHRRPSTPAAPRPDWSVLHVGSAFLFLVAACGLGLALVLVDDPRWTLRVVFVYGTFGLLGFLGQLILGLEMRLLPLLAWFWAFADSGFTDTGTPPQALPDRRLQRYVFLLWQLGVPILAGGLALDAVWFVSAGASALLAAAVLATLNIARLIRPGRRRVPAVPRPPLTWLTWLT